MAKNLHYQEIANEILFRKELVEILKAFNASDIPVVVLKGAALFSTVYSNSYARSMGDIDLLIRQEDRVRAQKLLEKKGYVFKVEPPQRFNPFRSAETGEMVFSRGKGFPIDLHWELISIEWLRWLTLVESDSFWQETLPLILDDAQALQLGSHNQLIHSCLHLVVHNFAHTKGYLDLVHLIEYYDPFPWDIFLERAERFQLRNVCFFSLMTIAEKTEVNIPPEVINELRPKFLRCWLVYHVADPRKGFSGELKYNHYRSYLLHLLMADQPEKILKVFIKLLFPGHRWLKQRYQLNGNFKALLACVWHPFFVLQQGLLSVRELYKK